MLLFARTLFRYLYFRLVRLCDLILNSTKPDFPLDQVKTILLIEVQDIGDTIIASPCMRQMRRRFPGASIHMLVQEKSLDMVQFNPNLDKALGVPSSITTYSQLLHTALKYRRKHYDLVISLSPSVRNNVIAAFSGGRMISGYVNDPFFVPTNYHDHPIDIRGYTPEKPITYFKEEPLIVRALKAAAYFDIDLTDRIDTELHLPEDSLRFGEQFLEQQQLTPDDLLIAFHPVCLNPYRNWPPEKFGTLGNALLDRLDNARIILIGIADDLDILNEIISLIPQKERVICNTSLKIVQTAAVIKRCNVLIGMDSAPSDISGALNVPTVHMHGPTAAEVTGPGGRRNFPVIHGSSCSPCGLNVHHCANNNECMQALEVSKVFDATMTALKKYSPNLVQQ